MRKIRHGLAVTGIADFQNNSARIVAPQLGVFTHVEFGGTPADHMADDGILGESRGVFGHYLVAIAKHRDAVRNRHHIVEKMRDEVRRWGT